MCRFSILHFHRSVSDCKAVTWLPHEVLNTFQDFYTRNSLVFFIEAGAATSFHHPSPPFKTEKLCGQDLNLSSITEFICNLNWACIVWLVKACILSMASALFFSLAIKWMENSNFFVLSDIKRYRSLFQFISIISKDKEDGVY